MLNKRTGAKLLTVEQHRSITLVPFIYEVI